MMNRLVVTCMCLPLFGLAPVKLTAQAEAGVETQGYLPAADGGLGSTMTLEQQGSDVARQPAAFPHASTRTDYVLDAQAAGESIPALKHRLWQPGYTLSTGSAQLHFSRALLMWTQQPIEFRTKVMEYWTRDQPPSLQEMQVTVENLQNVFEELHLLATSEDMSWDHRMRDKQGLDFYAYLLPEFQSSRDLARLLALKINFQLAQQDADGVVESLRDGFRLAAFTGQGETLVQRLVALAIQSIMLEQVQKLIELENSPNMYWPLATLPRPLVDITSSIQFELSTVHRIIPVLAEAETEEHGEEYWNSAWAEVLNDFDSLTGQDSSKIGLAVLSVAAAEPAKRRLIESGIPSEQVEKMPTMRVVLIDASREIRKIADDLAKAYYLPGSLGTEIGAREVNNMSKWLQANALSSGAATLAGLLFPAVEAADAAGVRTQLLVNRLMTIEAVRMHAAQHNGQLPKSLQELSPVPALPNPFNGQAFQYSLDRDEHGPFFVLSADLPSHLAELYGRIKVRIRR